MTFKNQFTRYFAADTETTVFDGQEATEIWACGCCELNTENCIIWNNFPDMFNYWRTIGSDLIVYFHNAAFDCEFIIYYLLHDLQYKLAVDYETEKQTIFLRNKDMKNNTFKTSISGQGEFYTLTIKTNNHIIECRDSFKLIPMSVKKMHNAFSTKHKKLDMEYTGERHAFSTITDEEEAYLKNDIYVLKEALEYMFNEGHTQLTIGSCCLQEYKKITGKEDFETLFPRLDLMPLDREIYGASNVDEYCRRGYRGAWCYVKEDRRGILQKNGKTCDCNSLYPSVMQGASGNYYPYGKPEFWVGDYIPDICDRKDIYFYMTLETRFYIKENHLPFIQKKNSFAYRANACLSTSDIYDYKTGNYYEYYIDETGRERPATITMTITKTDWLLMREHYSLVDCKILHGCYFYALCGIFDDYITTYAKLKVEAKEAGNNGLATISKLFLNNLYGKMASGLIPDIKIPYLDDDDSIGYHTRIGEDKKPVYIAAGAAVTSYARSVTIRAAQTNYSTFCYADTDSLHCTSDHFNGVEIHPSKIGAWKVETAWSEGFFLRQKAYIERVIEEDGKAVEPFYNIKGGGLPERSKELLHHALLRGDARKNFQYQYNHSERGLAFGERYLKITDYKPGLIIPDKLARNHIPGGIVLTDSDFTVRE